MREPRPTGGSGADDAPPGKSSRPIRLSGRLGGPLAVAALVVVLAMIAIGLVEVLSAGDGGSPEVAPAAPARAVNEPTASSASQDPVGFTGTDIVIVDPKSGEVTTAFELPGHEWNGERSPDGTRIVYQAKATDGSSQIFALDADGVEQQLTDLERGAGDPTWSPDGRQIAFISPVRSSSDIFVMSAHGNHLRRLAGTVAGEQAPDWSPDGAQIAFHTGYGSGALAGIWVANVANGSVIQLTSNGELDGDSFASWSPDGGWIAFLRYEDAPGGNLEEDDSDFWLMRPDGTEQHRLLAEEGPLVGVDPVAGPPGSTGDGHFQGPPTWSPDGSQIAYLEGHCTCISIVDVASGTIARSLFPGQRFDYPSWDAQGILVSEPRRVN